MLVGAKPIRFGPFELDVHSGELSKGGQKLKLYGKPIQVLTILIEHPNELVSRDDLRQRLWQSDTFVDFEHGLNTAVKRLRQTLGDNAEAPRYIETLPRRGYRFIGHLATEEMPVRAQPPLLAEPILEQSEQRKTPSFHLLKVAAAIALALLIAGVVTLQFWPRHSVIRSLAVLPLANFSGDPKQDYFADGMTGALINQLGKTTDLRVISRQSIMRYKNSKTSLPEIARELKVDALVEGSALQANGRVRITVELIRATPEHHLWAEAYERDLRDILPLQDEIARTIAKEIRTTVAAKASPVRPVNPGAYEAYLRGRYFYDRWPDGLDTSIQLFENAIAKDPNYAPPYAGLALAYSTLAYFRPPKDVFPKAKAAAIKALELDEAQSEAHSALGVVKLNFDWDWAGAEREMKRAIDLNPNSPEASINYAHYLTVMRRFDDAIVEAKRGLTLDPFSLFTHTELAWVYLNARRYDEAIHQYKNTLQLDASYGAAREQLLWCYTLKGAFNEALPEYEHGHEFDITAAYFYAVSGNRNKALRIIAAARRQEAGKYSDPYMNAIGYAGLGDKERALELLTQAYEERSASMAQIGIDPFFDKIRSDPRFRQLVRSVGFPE